MEDLLQVVREVPDFRNQIYEDNLTTLQADIGKLKTENARLHELVNGLQYDIKRMEDREWMLTKQARRSYDSDSGLDEPDESEYLVYRDTNGGVYSGNHGWTEEDDADHLTAQICYDRGSGYCNYPGCEKEHVYSQTSDPRDNRAYECNACYAFVCGDHLANSGQLLVACGIPSSECVREEFFLARCLFCEELNRPYIFACAICDESMFDEDGDLEPCYYVCCSKAWSDWDGVTYTTFMSAKCESEHLFVHTHHTSTFVRKRMLAQEAPGEMIQCRTCFLHA
jgi:hypothetical protein